jgi:hypothetical protein
LTAHATRIVKSEGLLFLEAGIMENVNTPHGQKVKCDCCGTETLAEIRDDKIIIMDKRHGRRHIAVLRIPELLEIIKSHLSLRKDGSSKSDTSLEV